MRRATLLSLLVISISHIFGQKNYHPPLGIPLILSANFGELRPNHFHMGVDFKTNGKEGYKLYSIDDGYVSRVKVSTTGYGKVVYINHPDGITSVYAHCSAFVGKLDSLVKKIQSEEQNFEIDFYPNKNEIMLKRGEYFALSGNTGSSTAPHLHFELRNTETEHALNPLVYGFEIADSRKPEIRSLKIYGVDEHGYCIPGKHKKVGVKNSKFGPYIPDNEVKIPSDFCSENGGIGLAFNVVDRFNDAENLCGLYGSLLLSDKDTIFGQKIDEISFDDSRYVNSHKDYLEYRTNKAKFHKSFRTKDNPLQIYTYPGLGVIPAKPGDRLNLEYFAYDIKSNLSQLKFTMIVEEGPINISGLPVNDDYIWPDQDYHFQGKSFSFTIPKFCTYEPVKSNFDSLSMKIGESKEPIRNPFIVQAMLEDTLLIAKRYFKVFEGIKTHALETFYEQSTIRGESKYFGKFSIDIDTLAPKIYPLNFKESDTTIDKNLLRWKITEQETSLKDFDLYINDKWHLLEYEAKGDYASFLIPDDLTGSVKIRIVACDFHDNISVWEKVMVLN